MRRPSPRAVVVILVLAAGVAAVAWWRVAGPGATTAGVGTIPRFVDETAASGLLHTYDGGDDFSVGAGVAAFDCNADGRPDLYLPGGSGPAELFVNESPIGGALRFVARHDPATDLTSVTGAYPIDVDGDGLVDLVVLRNGGNVALRGLGDCRFEDHGAAWGLEAGTRHTEAFSATWERGAPWPTIAFGNYRDPARDDPSEWCEPNELVRPAPGARAFAAPVDLTPSWCTLSVLFSDWSGTGHVDLRVSNDRHYYRPTDGQEQLWRIAPGEAPRLYGPADGWLRVEVEGMGIAQYDVTGDGLPDVYLTSQADNRLQTLTVGPSAPTYKDIGLKYNVNLTQPFTGPDMKLPSTAWHPEFEDVNNDGLVDLFVSKGNVQEQLDHAMADPSDLLLGQADGTFVEVADRAGILTFDRGRGAALADFNLDGRLDIVLAKYGAPVQMWRSVGPESATGAPPAHWLALRIREPGPNVDAIGGTLEVRAGDRTWRRELTIGGGHAGGELGWIHVGLGGPTAADVRVRWPDGTVGQWQTVRADGFYVVDRAGGTVTGWTPPS